MTKQTQHYHPLNIVLHWLMALLIPALFGVGLWMTGLDYYSSWYKTAPDLHKSFGILLALLLLSRVVAIRLFGKPAAIGAGWQQKAATLAHALMYALLLAIMVSGYLISTADNRGIMVFDWFEVPGFGEFFPDQADIAGTIHLYLAWALIALVVLHAAAALKHHFVDKDNTLTRMLGRRNAAASSFDKTEI
ncbi:cytochrome b [Rheinheimera sp. F8]|uniref:cytochrome b n=1 Tax=Rheinheimera sp. F8 TaxID=1763998 RepID=UPI000744AC47|nr:cytochrome b [Rheinheimera sp. F8]ALZ76845.1 cytochrome B [Rheinheimera sp. F8]